MGTHFLCLLFFLFAPYYDWKPLTGNRKSENIKDKRETDYSKASLLITHERKQTAAARAGGLCPCILPLRLSAGSATRRHIHNQKTPPPQDIPRGAGTLIFHSFSLASFASFIPFAVASITISSVSSSSSSKLSILRRRLVFPGASSGKKNWSTDIWKKDASS
jgi:hypothetical protein